MNFILQKIFNKFIYRPLIKLKLKKVGNDFRLGYLFSTIAMIFFKIIKSSIVFCFYY